MNTLLRWISPLILAVVTTAAIRLVTDISTSHPFWERPVAINLTDFLNSVISCYVLDFFVRLQVKSRLRKEKGWGVFGEYALFTLFLFVGTNLSLVTAHYFIDCPNYLIDFIIAYFTSIPIGLFYYTIIRNTEVRKKYDHQTLQLEKVRNKQLETELDFLKAQYHPHFLFNALNTVYFQVDEENQTARQTIELLSGLLRYQLYNIKNEVTLRREIAFMESYINFQKLRMSERLKLTFTHDAYLPERHIHPLLFQPLLENAFKYVGGEFLIDINLTSTDDAIRFEVQNSVGHLKLEQAKISGTRIGIENLRRRLELLYPGRHILNVERREHSFFAGLIIHYPY